MRYRAIRELLSRYGGEYTLFELSVKIFPDAIKNGAVFLVLSEVIGYLDWGAAEGLIGQVRDGSGIRYKLITE